MTAPLAGLRIGLLTASASRAGGGVFEAVVQQAAMIRALGGEPLVFALRDAFSDADAGRFGEAALSHARVIGPAQIGYAPGLLPDLLAARLDLLHLHGIWMYPSRAATRWARRTGKPYLISPHGMLDPWIVGRSPWKKWLARLGYERASWVTAQAMHALTGAETADIERECGRIDSQVIPNPAPPPAHLRATAPNPVVVYLGRIHPKKNLLALVEGWSRANLPADARLVIAGWGDAPDIARLEAAIAQAGSAVSYLGPTFGEAKQALLASAAFTILPSLGEGLPMAILEGWADGVPAIISPQCNLPEGGSGGAALVCGTESRSIADALEQAFALDASGWLAMSKAAQALAAGQFSPDSVAARWARVYRALVTAGP